MKRLRWYDYITINLFWLGLNFRNTAVGTIIMPYLVDLFVPAGVRNTAFGALRASGMNYAVIRPNGYFSDMGEFLDMAAKGRVYLFGPGNNEINPIHGADLAVTCVDALDGERQEIDVGGPQVLTLREIATMALEVQGKPVKITSVPMWLTRLIVAVTRFLNRHQGEVLAFLTTATTTRAVAPKTGTHTLKAFYEACVMQDEKSA